MLNAKNNRGLSKTVIVVFLGFIALVLGLVVWQLIKPKVEVPKKITLNVWGVWDDSSDLASMIESYQAIHPYVTINYKKLRYEEYDQMLVEGWATDSGPDIYAIPSSWINKQRDLYITPLPKTTRAAYYTTKKVLFTTETKISWQTETSLTAKDIRDRFIDVVAKDVVRSDVVYGLPFGINTLVMYYNKELLNQASAIQPPTTWADFISLVESGGITLTDEQDNIIRATAALGTAINVPRANDIVTLLMLQNSTAMVTNSKVTFDEPLASDPGYSPGVEALRFYTDFASPDKSTYTWNALLPNALDYFATGKLGFFFGYPFQEPELKNKNRGVSYGIAPVPQVDPNNKVNYANYWVYTVAKKSTHPAESWNFLQYAASPKGVAQYLAATKQSSVLKVLLNEELKNPEKEELAKQALTAKSWYYGKNPQTAEQYFNEMIEAVVADPGSILKSLTNTANKIEREYEQ